MGKAFSNIQLEATEILGKIFGRFIGQNCSKYDTQQAASYEAGRQ